MRLFLWAHSLVELAIRVLVFAQLALLRKKDGRQQGAEPRGLEVDELALLHRGKVERGLFLVGQIMLFDQDVRGGATTADQGRDVVQDAVLGGLRAWALICSLRCGIQRSSDTGGERIALWCKTQGRTSKILVCRVGRRAGRTCAGHARRHACKCQRGGACRARTHVYKCQR